NDQARLDQVWADTGVHPNVAVEAASLAMHAGNDRIEPMLYKRLQLLGPDRVRELVSNPEEVTRLALALGADANDVFDVAQDFVADVVLKQRITGALTRRFTKNPDNAPNLAVNEIPDHPRLRAIATELALDFDTLFDAVDDMRPDKNQGNFVGTFLQ